jgi:hypothetical protein
VGITFALCWIAFYGPRLPFPTSPERLFPDWEQRIGNGSRFAKTVVPMD